MKNKIIGLTEDDIKTSKEKYGDNRLKKEKTKGFVRRFFENLSDPIIRILMIALVIELIVTMGNCNYYEIFGIVFAILVSTIVSTTSEYTSEKSFEKLQNEELSEKVDVLRNGTLVKIPATDIVVGDIVYLSVGEKIVADGVIIDGEIGVDQSSLNGESIEVKKRSGNAETWDLSDRSRVFRGSLIISGSAIMKVERVGSLTYYGMVATDVQSESRISPLKLRLSRLASQVSKIGYIMAIIVGIAYIFNTVLIDKQFVLSEVKHFLSDKNNIFSTLIHAFTLMITVVVVAAPEGLPMMITVVLSANMKKLISNKVLVKKLVGIETAGSMNILFTDKTGTITEGEPKIEKIICDSGEFKSQNRMRSLGKIYEIMCICAKYNTDINCINGNITGGNSTDRSIYEWFKNERDIPIEVSSKVGFSSDKKYSQISVKNGNYIVKGAAEIILSACKYIIGSDGAVKEIDRNAYISEYEKAAKTGQRIIAVAVSDSPGISNLTLVGLIFMKDKIRDGAKDAVSNVLSAGIQVVMVTGDSKETARAIAEECGIIRSSSDIVISANELSLMSDNDIKSIFPNLKVVARALPRDKSRLVKLSQEMNLVVGMTGDGINDAPSLKLADIGFAMGSGTDIAKSAADIVILDNSFNAISKTVLYGRTIFKSIRKFITFQLIMNIAACGVSVFGQFIGVETPITIIQMLWVNIIMDTLGGLAFAGDPAVDYYMRERPKKLDEQIISGDMLHQIFYTGIYTFALSIFFLSSSATRNFFGFYSSSDKFYTAFYALFVFSGIANCFASRSDRLWLLSGLRKNIPFVIIMASITLIQIAMIYVGGDMFRCVPLTIGELMFALSLAFTVIPFDAIRRIVKKLS